MFRIDTDVLNYFTTELLKELLFWCILIVCTDVPYKEVYSEKLSAIHWKQVQKHI